MVKEIIISSIRGKIKLAELKKIILFARAITSNQDSIKKTELEYPSQGIGEIRFEIDNRDNNDLAIFLLIFLSFLQGIKFIMPKDEWYTLKCGNYIFNINEGGQNQLVRFL
jgi:hypothetical protein